MTLQITVVSSELITSIESVVIKDRDGKAELLNSALTEVGGRTAGYYTTALTLPHQVVL